MNKREKNIFLKTPPSLGYTRLPGATTNETKQKAVEHSHALAEAIIGPLYEIKSHDLGSTRYIIVTVPGHGGQIRSDDHNATKYTYWLDGHDGVEPGCFFSIQDIVKSRGHVGQSTQDTIAQFFMDNYILA